MHGLPLRRGAGDLLAHSLKMFDLVNGGSELTGLGEFDLGAVSNGFVHVFLVSELSVLRIPTDELSEGVTRVRRSRSLAYNRSRTRKITKNEIG